MITTWPCLTEAMHLVFRTGGVAAQNNLWSLMAEALVRLHAPFEDERQRIAELMDQYSDLPLDLADASLVSAAERLGIRNLFSLDSAMRAVRIHGTSFFDVLP
jgi:predicted nucleic acid-binding protein